MDVSKLRTKLVSAVKRAFSENIGLKVISMLLAVSLVAYHRGQEDEQVRTISVDIVWQLPPETASVELMTTMRPNVNVTLAGSRRMLDQVIDAGVQPIELDLREGLPTWVSFNKEMFSFPPEVKVKHIMPPTMKLEWQQIVVRKIPIQAALTGNVASGFTTGEVDVVPKEIEVRGPQSVVAVMQFARLAAFDVSGLSAGVHRRLIAIDAPPERVDYLGPASAAVVVEIKRRVVQLKFQSQTVNVVGVTALTVVPKSIDVLVTGPPEKVNGLREEQVVPRVDFSKAGINLAEQPHGSIALPVVVDLAGVEAEVQPPTVTVQW